MPGYVARALMLVGFQALLASCGSDPAMKTYVLGNPPPAAVGAWSEAGLPVIELMPVSVPDYLDTSDIVRRTGENQVVASPTGRWGERLSVGITRAFAADLARRLPQIVIATSEPSAPATRLLLGIDRFDMRSDGSCLLTAHWQLTANDGSARSAGEHASFSLAVGATDDPIIAAAMTELVDRLAAQVAPSVTTAMTRPS